MKIQDRLINDFFDTITKEVLPSFVLCENKNIESELVIIKNMFHQAKDDMKKIDPSLGDLFLGSQFFNDEFKKKITEITKYIQSRIDEPHLIYELGATLNEVNSLSDKTSIPLILKVYKEHNKLEEIAINAVKVNPVLKGLEFLKEKFFPKEESKSISHISENLWEELAKASLLKLATDFEFKSITIMGNQPWSEVYSWANDTHKAIQDAQENIGLSQKSAGIHKTLNLCYSPDSLFYKNSYGAMMAHEFSNTIILTQQPYEVQKSTWQHEFTHVLDNRSCIEYLKEIELFSKTQGHQNIFLSSLEMSNLLSDLKFKNSNKRDTQQAQIWTSEALSMIVNGKNTEAFKEYQKEAENKFLKEMSQYLIISFLPDQEKSWMDLSIETQDKLLKDKGLKEFTQYISINLYKTGANFLNEAFETKKENLSNLTAQLKKISSLVCPILNQEESTFLSQTLTIIEKNKTQFTIDLTSYLNKHSFSFDSSTPYFPTSESVRQASVEALEYNKNYWIMPIEILARASENLQQTLLIGTQEFHDNNEDYAKRKLVPQLNREERIVLINSLQSMAKSIGLEVIKEPEEVKSVEKQLNHMEELNFSNIAFESLKTYSTASGNEVLSKVLLNVAKLRASTDSRAIIKP